MYDFNSLQDVMNSTDVTTQNLLKKILIIEQKYEHLQTLPASAEKEISDDIIKLIIQELK